MHDGNASHRGQSSTTNSFDREIADFHKLWLIQIVERHSVSLRQKLSSLGNALSAIESSWDSRIREQEEAYRDTFVHWDWQDRALAQSFSSVYHVFLRKWMICEQDFGSVVAFALMKSSGLPIEKFFKSAETVSRYVYAHRQYVFLENHRQFLSECVDALSNGISGICIEFDSFHKQELAKDRESKSKNLADVVPSAASSILKVDLDLVEVSGTFDYSKVDVGSLYEEIEYEYQRMKRQSGGRWLAADIMRTGNDKIEWTDETRENFKSWFGIDSTVSSNGFEHGTMSRVVDDEEIERMRSVIRDEVGRAIRELEAMLSEYSCRREGFANALAFACGHDVAFDCLVCTDVFSDKYVQSVMKTLESRLKHVSASFLTGRKLSTDYGLHRLRKHLRLVQTRRTERFLSVSVPAEVLKVCPSFDHLKKRVFAVLHARLQTIERLREEEEMRQILLSNAEALGKVPLLHHMDAARSVLESVAQSHLSVPSDEGLPNLPLSTGADWVQSLLEELQPLAEKESITWFAEAAENVEESLKLVRGVLVDDRSRVHSASAALTSNSDRVLEDIVFKHWWAQQKRSR